MSNPAERVDTEMHLAMRSIIQRIATGPELSKDISREEAHLGARAILDDKVDPVQAGIFFIALRMKRESEDENKGVLDAIREATHGVTADVDEVVDIADPYDGYNRSLPASPFLGPLLAECGLHVVSHGLDAVGPKYGVTHRHVLAALGVPVDLSTQQAADRVADPKLGWSYVDQAQFCPKLHDLVPLRTLMIKRPVLTTVEVLAKPIAGRHKTHFVTGYVHKPYPPVYATLARHVGFDSALLIRGVEGGVIPSLRQEGKYFYYHDRGEEQDIDLHPEQIGIHQSVRAVPLPEELPKTMREGDEIAIAVDIQATAKAAAKAGMAALKGEKGPTYDSLVYGAALVLNHLRRFDDLAPAADYVRSVLDSGAAAARVA
jgi:anthranilate phosphoribosyltransferase